MEHAPKEERRRIFRNELYNLKELGYVSPEEYKSVSEAHNAYFLDLLANERQEKELATRNKENTSIAFELENKKVQSSANIAVKENQIQQPKPRPAKVKPRKSAEEIRERNISWSLNIGVIMLLIGGLFVATSNWESMTPWMKAGLIALVSALFYGIAYMSYKIIKIDKTAFAFVVLGSLFLPIFTLSLGWFELLGPYLSFYGEGRFILGAISSSVLIPIYAFLAKRLSSRLFVWFTFITTSISAAYLLSAIGLQADGFYLGLIIFNTLLIAAYHQLKKKDQMPLFTKELALYSQANLVLSTLLMLFFYENHVFNGFNLILTAIVYLSMIFVNGHKEYHFVFSAMFSYGAYQILENWRFTEVSEIGYALLGFVFLFVPRFIDDKHALKRAFQITSAVVSGLAFLFITAEGMMIHTENPSFILMAAYLIISANFIYLTNTNENIIFKYLSPVFLATAMFEAVLQIGKWIGFENLVLPIYFIGFILFILAGWLVKINYLQAIKTSSRDVGMVIMLFTILVTFSMLDWWKLALMFSLTSYALYVMMKIDSRPILPLIAQWAAPISLGLSAAAIGEEIRLHSSLYSDLIGMPGNFAFAGVLLLGASFVLGKTKESILSQKVFFSSHGFYAASLFYTFTSPVTNIYGESFIWFGGILMSLLLYRVTKESLIAFLSGVISLAWYLITMDSINQKIFDFSTTIESLIIPGGGWLLLGAAALLIQKQRGIAVAYSWIAHVYLAPIMAVEFIIYGEEAILSYLIATGVYAATIFFVKREWKVKSLLYAAFTTLFLAIKTGISYFTETESGHYAFLVTSILLTVFWLLSSANYKQRTLYYLIPISLLGVASFLAAYPFSWLLFGITIGYAAAILVLLHSVKWDIAAMFPLFMIFYGTIQILFLAQLHVYLDMAILSGSGVLLIFSGRRNYRNLWEKGGVFGLKSLDAYSLVGFLFIVSVALMNGETFWALIIHGLLMPAGLYMQRSRVHGKGVSVILFIAGAYLLVPYYAAVEQLTFPALLEREVYVLPFVALAIFVRFIFKERSSQITSYIQWAVLIMVSLWLIQDGLESNTVYDALILGSLSLISMLAGMWLRVKAYFFVGAGVLLLNVLLQTRPFWGNLPWWGYLLIAGSILIGVASFNEWNKQKGARREKTLLAKLKESLLLKMKNWN
ncbi:SCO7613 C-terminal domain-containing membrane protein [Mesobacillus sp.]|uniref:SCO7613 C-terminal domain-containing membrane protein n=1 Tax=Mesobacillus sp. TaxID=2675271 RepID=UPI0039F07F21